jgi:phosphate transport system permease protein
MTQLQDSSGDIPPRRQLRTKPFSRADRVFYGVTKGASSISIILVSAILLFLFSQSFSTFQAQGLDFITGSQWNNTKGEEVFQIGPMLWGSVLISILGIIGGVPMAIAAAYFIEFMAPKPIAKVATVLIDLLAAMPSIVIGLWGLYVLTPVVSHWSELLYTMHHVELGFASFDIPLLSMANGKDPNTFGGTPFIAGWIVAVMIVPIITSVTREIFSQMDRDLINSALALGGSRSSVFMRVILPTASGGVTGGVLLGLGRALGETVAIFYVLNLVSDINWFNILESKGGSIASLVLQKFGEGTSEEVKALMAAGLVLFVITLLVNWLAAVIVNRAQPWRKI